MAFSFPRPYSHKFTKEREGVVWCTIPRACPSPACGRGALLRHAFVALRAVVACAVPWLGTARCDGGFLLPCCSRIAAGLSI